jgi:hypothetical protein
MESIARKGSKSLRKTNSLKFWGDSLIQNYYIDYYNDLSSKELDYEFREDIKKLSKTLGKLSESDRKAFIELLSKFVEFYLDKKIEKELDNSFHKILKF